MVKRLIVLLRDLGEAKPKHAGDPLGSWRATKRLLDLSSHARPINENPKTKAARV